MECFLKRAFAKTERGARRVGARRVGARCGARRAGRVVRGVSRAIRCVARDFDLCLWARGDRGRFHEVQLEKRLLGLLSLRGPGLNWNSPQRARNPL